MWLPIAKKSRVTNRNKSARLRAKYKRKQTKRVARMIT